ncbi:MAG TPA: MBL fold metallo-hydrolase [Bacteroidia bacterium]|nr:MBL fold metallo-hydrolase [Bacteroidia bacterium]
MSLFISSINSGSNGNCYYIGNSSDAVLIDVGLSCREIDKRMLRSGLSMDKVRAIFISHEHIDHIRGVEALSKKYNLPVYINEGTYENGRVKLKEELVHSFCDGEQLKIRSLNVFPFFKSHDAADPYSFSVECDGVRVGVFTDIGSVCEKLIAHFAQCHAAFLEANYDEEMLANGSYPAYLKTRISGEKGHLSNAQALELFVNYRSPQLSHLILAHLSKENNTPGLVQQLFEENANGVSITVASRQEESPVFRIGKNGSEKVLAEIGQLSLGI